MEFTGSFVDYFNQSRGLFDQVRVLEIGARARPVQRTLRDYAKTQPKDIIYRATNSREEFEDEWRMNDKYGEEYWKELPEDEKPQNRAAFRKDYKQFSLQRLTNHVQQTGIDSLDICWDIEDLPFPFPDNYFTEVHCHMIDGDAVKGVEGIRINSKPTIEQFASEMSRLLCKEGLFFTSVQNGMFFDDDSTGQDMNALIASLQNNGVTKICRGWNTTDLCQFSRYSAHADDVLLSRKSL